MISVIRGMLVPLRFAKTLLAGFLLIAGGASLAPAAFAQHVVTDDEAGKLTLDALTAAPPPVVVHHYRPAFRIARASVSSRGRARLYAGRTAPLVQTVAYHRSARAAGHALASHRRRRG